MAGSVKQKKGRSSLFRFTRELCAILFWFYLVCKLAVFDLDNYLINAYSPQLHHLLYYKLFFLIGVLIILWLILGKRRFPKFVAYIIVYPLIILSWKIPKVIFRNWSIAIVFVPFIFEVVTTFRTYLIRNTLVAIAALCILTLSNHVFLLLSMLILAASLLFHLYSSFRKAYRSTVFYRLSQLFSKLKEKLSDVSFLQNITGKTKTASEVKNGQDEFHSKLSTLYCFHWGVEFLGEKLRQVAQSRKMDIYLIAAWFWTVLFTALIFSLEYFALYKMTPGAFSISFEPSYFSFLGFSIGKLTHSGMSTILPASLSATLLCYFELACSLVIFVILVFTILTAARERYKEDIESIISEVNLIASIIQGSFQSLFNMALSEAEYILVNHNAALVNGLRKLRGLPELSAPRTDKLEGQSTHELPENKD